MMTTRCVVEILGEGIKVFQGRMTRMSYVPGKVLTGDSADPHLRKLISGCRECVLMVPRRKVILRSLRLPSLDHQELDGMVSLHLTQSIPYPIGEVIYGYQVLRQEDGEYSRVLAVIVPKVTVQTLLEHARGLGIRSQDIIVTVSSYGLQGWWERNGLDQPTVLIDLDMNQGEICFCSDRKMFFSRHLPYGRADVAAGNIDTLVDEIGVSLGVYQNHGFGPVPQKMVLLLPFEEGKILREILEKILGIPAAIVGTLDGFPAADKAVQAVLDAHGERSFTAGLGLMAADAGSLVNLVPGEIEQEKKVRNVRRQCAAMAGMVMAAGVAAACGELTWIHKTTRTLGVLEARERQVVAAARDAREKINLVSQFDKEFSGRPFIPDILETLRLLTPEGITLRTLTLDDQGHLTLQGYARDHSQVNQLQSELARSQRFQNVDMKFSTNRQVANRAMTDFKIAAELAPQKEDAR